MNRKLVTRYLASEAMAIVGMGLALFWSAGQINWWPAWAALSVNFAWLVAMDIVIFRFHPDLLPERLGARKGAKPWDIVITSIIRLTQLARYILAGLDQRFGWTGDLPVTAQIAALTVCGLGDALFVWAIASNAFFSQVVRIQSERGHVVVTGGPYQYVRHPAYLGAILYELTVPVLLVSWWALLISGLSAVLLIMRTMLEDRMLQAELAGYAEYTRQVRYRLIPGIW